jgi:hypothetical protein
MSTAAAHPIPRFDRLDWREFFDELYRRSRVLAITGWIHFALLAGMLVVSPFDSRLVMGINPWIKPIKFAISITIYVWTVAWLLEYLLLRSWTQRIISWGISVSMLTEIACIIAQAARGTTSHYNVNTPLDAAIFSTLGSMIALNSQPISDTHSQPPDTFYAPYACRKVRTEESAIGRFICQPAYRRQSQVDRRRSIWVLFEGNPVSCDHRPVEGESRL